MNNTPPCPDQIEHKTRVLFRITGCAFVPGAVPDSERPAFRGAFDDLMAEARKSKSLPGNTVDDFLTHTRAATEESLLRLVPFMAMLAANISDEAFDAAVTRLELGEPLHPKFIAAGEAMERMREELGEEAAHQHPEYQRLFSQVLKYAPRELLAAMNAKAREMGLMPETKFVDDAGRPIFTAEQIAETFGVPLEEVQQFVQAHGEDFSPPAGSVHPVQ